MAKSFVKQRRDTRYVFVFIVAGIVFLLTALQALNNGFLDSIERPLFEAVNNLPSSLKTLMYGFTQFGGLTSIVLWIGFAWYLINKRAALSIGITGVLAWVMAGFFKVIIQRGRPGDLLLNINLLGIEKFSGYGFPSGHATFSAACVTVLYFQVDSKYRKYLLVIALLVGVSRIYLGAHFPLDIVGGWALGASVGSFISLLIGSSKKDISPARLKGLLNKKGFEIESLRFAKVDARGSRPIFFEDARGQSYFGKIFGKQEHAADWLFKIYRLFRFKNLQAEEPYINSRRNIEMESFACLWARQEGVRVPKICNVVQLGSLWILIQERIAAEPLSDLKRVSSESLDDTWRQVNKLHKANVAHRDLRAANIMIDKSGEAWIIDFGFAEVSPRRHRQYMDLAELLMSMSLVVGTKRTVSSALKIIDPSRLKLCYPYLQTEVFSGATTKLLRKNKSLLIELKNELKDQLAIDKEIQGTDIIRINLKKIINIALLATFLYVVVPQFNAFRSAFHNLGSIRPGWILPMLIATAMTYVLTALIYIVLADVPLKVLRTSLVQLASSFVSKVIPGGLGGTTLNARYLVKEGLPATDTSAVVVYQSVIGMVMFVVPLALFLLFSGESVTSLIAFHISRNILMVVMLLIIALAAIILFSKKTRIKLITFVSKFVTNLRDLSSSPRQVTYAGLLSLSVTLCNIVCLWVAAKALGIPIGVMSIVFAYASAVIAKSAIPTPGGLGPFEVALAASLVSLQVDKPLAFSTVLLYRLVTYWLPIPFSFLAYRQLTKQKII